MVDTAAETRLGVESAFVLEDRGQIAVHVASFDWDFQSFGLVRLHVGDETIRAQYVGFANLDGAPVLFLESADGRDATIEQIKPLLGKPDRRGMYRPAAAHVCREEAEGTHSPRASGGGPRQAHGVGAGGQSRADQTA